MVVVPPRLYVSAPFSWYLHSWRVWLRVHAILAPCLCSSSTLLCVLRLISPLRLKMLLFSSYMLAVTYRFYLAVLNLALKFSNLAPWFTSCIYSWLLWKHLASPASNWVSLSWCSVHRLCIQPCVPSGVSIDTWFTGWCAGRQSWDGGSLKPFRRPLPAFIGYVEIFLSLWAHCFNCE